MQTDVNAALAAGVTGLAKHGGQIHPGATVVYSLYTRTSGLYSKAGAKYVLSRRGVAGWSTIAHCQQLLANVGAESAYRALIPIAYK